MGDSETIILRRSDTSQPWGFKMQGGTDVNMPLFVAHVTPGGIASQSGVRAGDGLLEIGNMSTSRFTHEEARGEIIRSGNEVRLVVQRGLVRPPDDGEIPDADRPRMSVSDSDSPYQEVVPKTYQVIEKEQATGGRPASIFDKKRQNRSAYTKADKSGYIKPYGAQ